jgi:hypothetical protein
MGLTDFFRRLTGRTDKDVLDRANRETHMSDLEREYDAEDYEAKKDDMYIKDRTWAGSGAERAAEDDLGSL